MAASSWRASRTCGTAWAKALRWDIPRSRSLVDWRWNMVASSSATSSIYRFIYHRTAQKDYWHRLLPRHKLRRGRRRRPSGSPASFIKQRRSIAERPAEVEGRETSGHWEADFMLFARYGQGLLVLHERQTRFSIVLHPLDRKAVLTARTIARQLGKLPQTLRKTISFDNGTEFAEHHRLHNAIGSKPSFAIPIAPGKKAAWKIPSAPATLPATQNRPQFHHRSRPPSARSASQRYPTQMPGLQDTRRGILQTQINRCTSNVTPPPACAGMTTECDFAISRRIASEVCIFVCPLENQRAQGRPGARCTRGLVCNCAQKTRTRAYRFSGNTPAFPAQWLYGL